jgi:hypothetical protein
MEQWVIKLPNWYEGFSKYSELTNNGLESTNRCNEERQFRERLPLNEFLKCFLDIPMEWSAERMPSSEKEYRDKPSITLALWTEAYR